jgi:EpsD family peptidyl-prolyl cis-trans isomerase
MTPAPSNERKARPAAGHLSRALFVLAVPALVLGGCGDSKKDTSATQTAARVNKEEITVHQINLLLQQQRGLQADRVEAASKQVLQFLVDQELAVQKTREMKIDQDPRVMLQIETVKREVLARAYADKVGESAVKPSAEQIRQYYLDKPALFRERRIYSIQELTVEARSEQLAALGDQVERKKSITEVADYVKSKGLRFSGNQGVRAAEQLPADVLDKLSQMKDGQMVLLPSPAGALVVMLVYSRADPIDEARASAVIERFLLNDAKRKLVEADVKALRAAAKIDYVGKFAAPAAPAASMPIAAETPTASTSGDMSADEISKGLGIRK